MKVKVTITTVETHKFDAGDLPPKMLEAMLRKNKGTFDGNWAVHDISNADSDYTVTSVEVEEVA